MRRVVSEIGTVDEEFEVGICDKCGREATEELTLVPKKELMEYLEEHLSALSRKLTEVQEEIEPVPEPSVRLEKDIKTEGHDPGANMANIGYLGYGPTTGTLATSMAYSSIQMNRGAHTVKNYIYEELDSDEEELVKIAESLEGRRKQVLNVAREIIHIIERMQRLSIVENSFDLCKECYDRDYKWGEEETCN